MKKNPLVSVIIPIYDVEIYLAKCIESVLAQTYHSLEVFLVNDGSPDNCGSICDEYAQKDNRIVVIHKKNGGLSDARNVAIDIAKGEYITFVDSDDYISPYYIETLLDLATESDCDIAVTSLVQFQEGEEIAIQSCNYNKKVFEVNEAINEMFYQGSFDNSAWAKLYHRSLFSSGIRYPIGILYEDLATTYKLFLLANKVAFSNRKTYFYLIRSNSIEGSPFNEKKMKSVLFIIGELEKFKKSNPEFLDPINCRIMSFLLHVLFETNKGSKSEKELFLLVKKYRMSVLKNSRARKKTIIASLLSFLGISTLRLFYQISNKRN